MPPICWSNDLILYEFVIIPFSKRYCHTVSVLMRLARLKVQSTLAGTGLLHFTLGLIFQAPKSFQCRFCALGHWNCGRLGCTPSHHLRILWATWHGPRTGVLRHGSRGRKWSQHVATTVLGTFSTLVHCLSYQNESNATLWKPGIPIGISDCPFTGREGWP